MFIDIIQSLRDHNNRCKDGWTYKKEAPCKLRSYLVKHKNFKNNISKPQLNSAKKIHISLKLDVILIKTSNSGTSSSLVYPCQTRYYLKRFPRMRDLFPYSRRFWFLYPFYLGRNSGYLPVPKWKFAIIVCMIFSKLNFLLWILKKNAMWEE